MNQSNRPPKSLNDATSKIQQKDQFKNTFDALWDEPKTMLQVAREIGVERANICRYVATLRKAQKVAVAKKGICPITLHEAGFLTTDPAKFPPIAQLTISFEPKP